MQPDSKPFALGQRAPVVAVSPTPEVLKFKPHKRIQVRDSELLLLRHDVPTTHFLRKLGYNVPSPILQHYDWAGATPFESQKTTAAMLTMNRRAYVLSDMGTGKTLSALFAFDYLRRSGLATTMLVVAPLSTLHVVWASEVFRWMPHLECRVLHGSKAQRLRELAKPADIYVINHAGVKVLQEELHARKDIDVVLLDELAVYRNRRTELWVSADKLVKPRKFAWGMTGGPTPKYPTDAWAQIRLLTPDNVTWSFTRFRDDVMFRNGPFNWTPRDGALKRVHALMQPAVRFKRDECIDLPPTTYSEREVDLTKEQAAAYKKMQDEFYVEHPDGDVTAVNAGVQAGKLLQICCGFVYGPDEQMIELDHRPRINTMLEVIEEADAKVIVYVPFVKAVQLVERGLVGKYSFGTVTGQIARITDASGNVENVSRNEVFSRFQNDAEPHVLVAHPKVAAHGLTLTAANIILWYGLLQSDLEIYSQACARVARPGQKLHTHIIHLVGTKAERKISRTLKARGNLQAALLSLFREDGRY